MIFDAARTHDDVGDDQRPDAAVHLASSTVATSRVTASPAEDTGRWIGARLRSIREQKQLSLVDVERLSNGSFGTSTIGAYERGDRTITIPRLDRLADFYGVPIEQFLPRPPGQSPITTRASPVDDTLSIDMVKLQQLDGQPFDTLLRFIGLVRTQRADRHPEVVTLRGADAVVIAALFAVSVDAVVDRLAALDLLVPGPAPG